MGLSSKFFLALIVCIAFQTINAWPFFISRWKNIGYEINRAADDADRDVRKDLLSVKNKSLKETEKIIRKSRDEEQTTVCLVELESEYEKTINEAAVTAFACIENVRNEANAIEEDQLTSGDFRSLKNELKKKVKDCRNEAKDIFKTSIKEYTKALPGCLVGR